MCLLLLMYFIQSYISQNNTELAHLAQYQLKTVGNNEMAELHVLSENEPTSLLNLKILSVSNG